MAEIQLNKVYQYDDIILLLRYLFSFEWSETKFLEINEVEFQSVPARLGKKNQWIRHLHLTRKQIRGVLT